MPQSAAKTQVVVEFMFEPSHQYYCKEHLLSFNCIQKTKNKDVVIGPFALAGNKKIAYLCGNEVKSLVYKSTVKILLRNLRTHQQDFVNILFDVSLCKNSVEVFKYLITGNESRTCE